MYYQSRERAFKTALREDPDLDLRGGPVHGLLYAVPISLFLWAGIVGAYFLLR